MSIAVNLDDKLVKDARAQSKVLSRSVTKQIEHWARIGHIAEDNPDLTYTQIKDILLGLEEHNMGCSEEYKRGVL
ncbi:MAG: ParD-like family protein [Gammaproteobacteria bacterium]|nr:ParD-like family protein [Gammaproteobacteria bacterium]